MNKIYTNEMLGQSFRLTEHASGLTILTCPIEGFTTAYAMFAAKVGSIDTTFKTQKEDDFVEVPAGIAHFLEHKMFESEEGDAFEKYAKTGASANAYTAFDRTAYLFACTDNFRESMEILLRQVTTPYFTPETVEKEQGIIGQEIRMYDDSPEWRVMFNLFGALYHNNPIKIDIAGTVESISEISADLLYRCYNTFYNLNNMVLVVAGNFDEKDVMELADEILTKGEDITIEHKKPQEPRDVVTAYVEQTLPVATPLFQIGFKGVSGTVRDNMLSQVIDEIIQEMICGEASDLYRKMYDGSIINSAFETEVMAGRDYLMQLYQGESRDPKAVYDAICAEIERLRREGFDKESFERSRKATYGRYIAMYCKAESVAGIMLATYFADIDNMYELLDFVKNLTLEQVTERFMLDYDTKYSALSVIKPV